jgi:hypothetical protein
VLTTAATALRSNGFLAWLTRELLGPALLDSFDAVALVVGVAAGEVAVRQQLLNDMATCVVKLLVIAHLELLEREDVVEDYFFGSVLSLVG